MSVRISPIVQVPQSNVVMESQKISHVLICFFLKKLNTLIFKVQKATEQNCFSRHLNYDSLTPFSAPAIRTGTDMCKQSERTWSKKISMFPMFIGIYIILFPIKFSTNRSLYLFPLSNTFKDHHWWSHFKWLKCVCLIDIEWVIKSWNVMADWDVTELNPIPSRVA